MSKSFLFGVAASVTALFALPAAANWQDKIDSCAAAVEAEGLAEIADYDVKFISASARRLTIELAPTAGGDSLLAECRVSRGKISAVELLA